jgi:subtilisin family serine protease
VVRMSQGVGVVITAIMTALVAMGGVAQAQPAGKILGTANPDAIANSYIVVFKPNTATHASTLANKYRVKAEHTYRHALLGFAGPMSRRTAEKLALEPEVAWVEQNGKVQREATQPLPPSWGLDRIDQRNLPLDSSYSYPNTAANVRAYILDTGIRLTHTTFGGRAIWGTNTSGDGINTDCIGHGTGVAAIVGGAQFGVAKAVTLVDVKVLPCNDFGNLAGVAAGVDWVTGDHVAGTPAVANMSLGSVGTNLTIETAVRNSINDGVTYAIASGNNGSDACNFTPARVTEAVTVNASSINDARASFSNHGPCTDIFAPGEGITTAVHVSDTATAVGSGTSLAAPHVTGAAAMILSAKPSLTPAQVAAKMFANATQGVITNAGTGSPNRLLFVNTGGAQATLTLSRYYNGTDHISETANPGGAYQLEGPLGRVVTSLQAGTAPIFQCLNGGEFFTSRAINCEGKTVVKGIGFVHVTQVPNTHPLYRCRSNGEHFDSVAANCEGQTLEGILGFLLN